MRENDIRKQAGLALHYILLAGLAGGFAEILWSLRKSIAPSLLR